MRSALIVCTRNRPDDVRRLFSSILHGNSATTVMVMDSSDGDDTRAAVAELVGLRFRYERCAPGLTRQRMAGVTALDPEVQIVHFVDDDVVLEPGYLAAIEETFDTRPEVLGVGGRITNMPAHDPRLLHRVFLLDSVQGGVVLRSGVNVLAFGVPDGGRVDWLSGCSMSFRRKVFDEVAFDLRMEGYSLGEDVDFTFRVSRCGPLCIAGEARLAHMISMTNRQNYYELARQAVVRRYRLVSEMHGRGVRLPAFWWSVVGDIILTGAKGALLLRRSPLRRLRAIIQGIRDIARAGEATPGSCPNGGGRNG
jgi:GT2 family glycosyltransferase